MNPFHKSIKLPLLSILCGVFAAAISRCYLHAGINGFEDSWAYWEGSVSILEGCGYRYFGGQPITVFPPMFSVLLALWQWIFGISGLSLLWNTVFLSASTAGIWHFAFHQLLPLRKWLGISVSCLLAIFMGTYVPQKYQQLLSENLFLALLGSMIIALTRLFTSNRGRGKTYCVLILLLVLMLSTRNVGIIFIPGTAITLAFGLDGYRPFTRFSLSASCVAIPLAVWVVVRMVFAQVGAHVLGLGGKYGVVNYLQQLAHGLASLTGPDAFGIGGIVLTSILGVLGAHYWTTRKHQSQRKAFLPILILLGTALICIIALFNMTFIEDRLGSRFLWFVPLFLSGLVSLIVAESRVKWIQLMAGFILVVVVGIQCKRTAIEGWRRLTSDSTGNLKPYMTISSGYVEGPSQNKNGQLLVPPMNVPWVDRNWNRHSEQ